MTCLRYVAKRVAYMVVVFFVISFIMYFIYNLIPGDPAAISLESVRDELTADEYEQMYQQARARLGLDMIRSLSAICAGWALARP